MKQDINLYLLIFFALNIATFFLMAFDKLAAIMKWRRIPENIFYLLTFLGGSIGMLLGMYTFRHKTRKTSFQFVVAILIFIQVGIVFWLSDFF